MLYICILLIFVFFAGIAMTMNEGIWNNTVNLLCLLISAPTAFVMGLPLGNWGFEQADTANEYLWYFMFAGIWLVFFVTMLVLKEISSRVSRVRMRFLPQLEMIAGPLMGLFTTVMFTSFFTLTLYCGPMAASYWDSSQAADWEKSLLGNAVVPARSLIAANAGESANLLIDKYAR